MNNLGFSKDSVNIGDFRIKGQGETLIIGNENGGDGYILPTEKGIDGQILTMNADNSTSFQDPPIPPEPPGITGRIVKNIFTMIDDNDTFSGFTTNVYLTGYGSLDLGSIDNFPVGSTLHLYTKGTFNVGGGTTSNSGDFHFIINSGQATEVEFFGPVQNEISTNKNFYYTDIILQRTATNEYKFKGAGIRPASTINIAKINWVSSTFSPATPFTTIDLRFAYSTDRIDFYPITAVLLVDLILDSSLLIDPPPAPTSHLALTDLNAGDSGHPQFALLQGKLGGQVLSGGITPANFLTLKSHTAGLNNIVVKDLNTEFKKDIDLDNNNIINALSVSSSASLQLKGVSFDEININPNPSTGISIFADTGKAVNILADGANQSIVLDGTFITFLQGGGSFIPSFTPSSFDMNNGPIDNVGNVIMNDNTRIDNTNNGYSLRNSRDGPTDNIFIAPTENIFFKGINLQSGVNITFPFSNNSIGSPTNKLNNLWVNNINGLSSVGGLFSGTSDSLNVSATTSEISILPLTFVGVGFGVPPDGFSVGDCFELKLSGPFNSANSDTLTIRLKGGPTATTLLATLVVPLNASSGSVFQLTVFFQIRAIGVAGVADIISDADLTYNQSGGGGAFVGEQSLSQNNTTFDTTLANILDVTAQFGSTNASNDMTTRVSKLQKTF